RADAVRSFQDFTGSLRMKPVRRGARRLRAVTTLHPERGPGSMANTVRPERREQDVTITTARLGTAPEAPALQSIESFTLR
ncbi:MAG: hypothetical protein ACJ79W_15280, partial [Myxococcales bacterium]